VQSVKQVDGTGRKDGSMDADKETTPTEETAENAAETPEEDTEGHRSGPVHQAVPTPDDDDTEGHRA
jgi:hypothetical protein